ncbi:MAG: preprotein translocase subunit SecY, partial [Candidatus Zixiibacteriota bacterium]
MIQSFRNIFKIPELRKRILFTLGILIVYRLGGHISSPGINAAALQEFFELAKGSLFGLYDMFAGGNLSRATIFALGIMPYISASIIIQLLSAVLPYFQKLQREGEEGRRKITQYTRYGTVLISV